MFARHLHADSRNSVDEGPNTRPPPTYAAAYIADLATSGRFHLPPRDTNGGLDVVATVVSYLFERLDLANLAGTVQAVPFPWARRLGYVLQIVGGARRAAPLGDVMRQRAREYVPLATGARSAKKRSTGGGAS